jgi:hypothetical protein
MIIVACIALVLLVTMSCTPTVVAPVETQDKDDDTAGFWRGLWHGFTVLFMFIISLFKDGVGIYEWNNSGNLYNLGFVLGAMIFFGGSSGGACKKGK